jgi:hypothetical protein
MSHEVARLALVHLRTAHEPLREAVLYDRISTDLNGAVTPDAFVETMERLMTQGHVHVISDREPTQSDPVPFSPRYYRIVA